MTERRLVLGIDPGLHGALALYDAEDKRLVRVEDMPVCQTKIGGTQLNVHALAILLDGVASQVRFAVVEDVHAMTYTNAFGETRGQGAAASFNFGKNHGVVIGVLASLMVPVFFVQPSVWKRLMGLGSSKSESLSLARKMFAGHEGSFLRKKDDGRAEAALMAYFGADRLT